MSELLRTIIGNVIPENPLQDEVPVPYRPTQLPAVSRTSTNDGSQSDEPSEGDSPITE